MTYASLAGLHSPALNHFVGLGVDLHFQDGAPGEFGVNGTTNEEVIQVLLDRLESLQAMHNGAFACSANAAALAYLQAARQALELRAADRQHRGVEGTSTP